jgi:hypothetical protein
MKEKKEERKKDRKLEREKDYTVYKDKRRFFNSKSTFLARKPSKIFDNEENISDLYQFNCMICYCSLLKPNWPNLSLKIVFK